MIRKTIGLVILACASMAIADPPEPGMGENEVKSPIKITSTSYDLFNETLTVGVATHRKATGDPGWRRVWVSLYAEMASGPENPVLYNLYQKIENWDAPVGDENKSIEFDIGPDVFDPFLPGYEMTGEVRVVIETAWWNLATGDWETTDTKEEYVWYYW